MQELLTKVREEAERLEVTRSASPEPVTTSAKITGAKAPSWTMALWLEQLKMWEVVRDILQDALLPDLKGGDAPHMKSDLVSMLAEMGSDGMSKLLADGQLLVRMGERLHEEMEKLKKWQNREPGGNEKYQVQTMSYGHVSSARVEPVIRVEPRLPRVALPLSLPASHPCFAPAPPPPTCHPNTSRTPSP